MSKIQASKLDEHWLDSFKGVKVLSLDCFDTLLWRKVGQPTDVFYALANTQEYKKHGLTANLRIKSESLARRRNQVVGNTSEVSLEDIYRAALPDAEPAHISELATLELELEIQHGFIFKPVAELVKYAKARGLKVVIVSDTYFAEPQLKKLLFSLMPDLEGLIDNVFCSSTYGVSKAGGIWQSVIPKLKVQPREICHIGDNIVADLHGALRFGIQATHLEHYTPEIADILTQRSQVAAQLLPQVRNSTPLPDYFHALLSANRACKDAPSILGYATLGPILYAFADFVLSEIDRLKAAGQKVKVGFLLRDGFLPRKACTALHGSPVGFELNISRFTAIAASLDSKEAVMEVLESGLSPETIPLLLPQLLIPEDLAAKIVRLTSRATDPVKEFVQLIQQKKTLNTIFEKSREFRSRLIAHLRLMGVENGDTLIFVDLGYTGTAQLRLRKILREDMDVTLLGCYLIASEVSIAPGSRKGLIDASWVDSRIITALTGYIAAFEMLCTQNMPSTVDYTPEGKPIYSSSSLSTGQHKVVELVQEACLRFIQDFKQLAPCFCPQIEDTHLAQSAAIDLARYLFFPTQSETELLEQFQFDFNLGTDLEMALFDQEAGLEAMRREGFTYMNSGLFSMRMNYPAELRSIDISLSNLLFSSIRFGFPVQPGKVSFRKEVVKVLFANDQGHISKEVEARSTYDGFYSLLVPVGEDFCTAILLGQSYTWVQVDAIQLLDDNSIGEPIDIEGGVTIDQMQHHENGVFELSRASMIYLSATVGRDGRNTCRVTFRPLARRQ